MKTKDTEQKDGEEQVEKEDITETSELVEEEAEGLTKVSVWIPSKLNEKLEDLAEKRGISKSDVIRNALLDRLKAVKPVDQQVIKKLLVDSHDFLGGFDLDKFLKQAKARGLNTSELWSEANLVLLKDAILEDAVGDGITDELENDEISKVATELGIEESFLRKAWNLANRCVECDESLSEDEQCSCAYCGRIFCEDCVGDHSCEEEKEQLGKTMPTESESETEEGVVETKVAKRAKKLERKEDEE